MYKFFVFPLIIITITACSSSKYTISTDQKGKIMLIGKLTYEEWQKDAGWASYSADNYEPEYSLTVILKQIVKEKNITFKLFSGSWCEDSESEVPKIFKLLNESKISLDKIDLYGVDREKKESTGEAEKYKIERVPTLLILKGDNEVGRIIEYPDKSWEEDILTMISEEIQKLKE